jgi:antitoxin CptB
MMGEASEAERRLRWRCRRGLLELDVWLARYVEARLAELSEAERGLLERLLQEADADLLAWLNGQAAAPEVYRALIESMRTTV